MGPDDSSSSCLFEENLSAAGGSATCQRMVQVGRLLAVLVVVGTLAVGLGDLGWGAFDGSRRIEASVEGGAWNMTSPAVATAVHARQQQADALQLVAFLTAALWVVLSAWVCWAWCPCRFRCPRCSRCWKQSHEGSGGGEATWAMIDGTDPTRTIQYGYDPDGEGSVVLLHDSGGYPVTSSSADDPVAVAVESPPPPPPQQQRASDHTEAVAEAEAAERSLAAMRRADLRAKAHEARMDLQAFARKGVHANGGGGAEPHGRCPPCPSLVVLEP